ncbi:Casanova [Gryganskiella cystojenkinii]|nr:Casanova [Gryganskiella cystojenkinii]
MTNSVYSRQSAETKAGDRFFPVHIPTTGSSTSTLSSSPSSPSSSYSTMDFDFISSSMSSVSSNLDSLYRSFSNRDKKCPSTRKSTKSSTAFSSSPSPSCSSSSSSSFSSSSFSSSSFSSSSSSSITKSNSKSKSRPKPTSTGYSSASQPKKIPRPSNSFLIYRKEHAVQYAGLVATELSAKLALAWRHETEERRNHYAVLAEKLKQEHAIKYPNYKFTPVKRGTGKRAQALAAQAEEARTAATAAAASTTMSSPPPTSSLSSRSRSRSTREPARCHSHNSTSSVASSSATDSTDASVRITTANRPKRNIHRPQRYSPTAPYSYRTNSFVKRDSTLSSSSPSLLFGSSVFNRSDDDEDDSTNIDCNHEDEDESTIYIKKEENNESDSIEAKMGRFVIQSQAPYHSPRGSLSIMSPPPPPPPPPPPQQQPQQQQQQQIDHNHHPQNEHDRQSHDSLHGSLDTSIFTVHIPMIPMEPFEPECLAHSAMQWNTTSTTSSLSLPPMLSMMSPPASSFPNLNAMTSYGGYSTPVYEATSSQLQFHMEMDHLSSFPSISSGGSISKSTVASWPHPFPSPMATPPCLDMGNSNGNIDITSNSFPFGYNSRNNSSSLTPSSPAGAPSPFSAASLISSPATSPMLTPQQGSYFPNALEDNMYLNSSL